MLESLPYKAQYPFLPSQALIKTNQGKIFHHYQIIHQWHTLTVHKSVEGYPTRSIPYRVLDTRPRQISMTLAIPA